MFPSVIICDACDICVSESLVCVDCVLEPHPVLGGLWRGRSVGGGGGSVVVHRSAFYRKLVLIYIGYEICEDISPFGLKFESASPPILPTGWWGYYHQSSFSPTFLLPPANINMNTFIHTLLSSYV